MKWKRVRIRFFTVFAILDDLRVMMGLWPEVEGELRQLIASKGGPIAVFYDAADRIYNRVKRR